METENRPAVKRQLGELTESGRPRSGNKFTKKKKDVFLKALVTFRGNISKACKVAGVHRNTVIKHSRRKHNNAQDERYNYYDNEFAEKYQEVMDSLLDNCEENLLTLGGDEGVKGITPAIFMLKSHRKEQYGENVQIEHKRSGPIANKEQRVDSLVEWLRGKGYRITKTAEGTEVIDDRKTIE